MKNIIERAEKLKEYKNRVNESFKHLRGRHNQLDHAWNRGMGRGDSGGGGVALAPNQYGPLPTEDFYRQRKIELVAQEREGQISNDQMRRELLNLRGITADEVVFANRAKPKKTDTTQVAQNKPSARPERLARLPLTQRRISDPSQRRRIAQEQQADWNRRHRMTKQWATEQGLVSPIAMAATPIESRHDQYEIDDTSTNLFENPYLITGVDESGNQTNFMDYYTTQYTALTSRMEDVLNQLVSAGTVSESDIQQMYDKVLDAEQIIRQAVLRKAAATFATDIQGFLGGQVYGTDDPEFLAAMGMAADANQRISLQTAIVEDFGDKIAQLPGLSEDDKDFFTNLVNRFIEEPYNKWSALQMEHQGVPAATTGTTVEARLARMNPSLATDMIERAIEYSSGSAALSIGQESDINRNRIRSGALPAANSDRITMSLSSLFGFLHPKIQERLKTIMQQKIQYPTTENPSDVIKRVPGVPLGADASRVLDILGGMMDAVHTDGGMSEIVIAESSNRDEEGYFSSRSEVMARENLPDTGTPIIGIVNPRGKNQDLPLPIIGSYGTAAHEMAHHMDATALPFGTTYWRDTPSIASPSGGPAEEFAIPTLTTIIGEHGAVPAEIAEKAPFAPAILAIMSRYQQTVQARNKRLLATKDPYGQMQLRAYLQYLDSPHEVFARLYQQYMMNQLRDRLQSGQDVPGIAPADRQRALESAVKYIEKHQAKQDQNKVQSFFDDADIPVAQLEEIFTIMGWKFK